MTRMILAFGLTLASAAWAEEVQLVPPATGPVVSADGLSNGPPRRWINAVGLTTGTSAVDAGIRLSGGPQRRWNNGAPVTAAPSP